MVRTGASAEAAVEVEPERKIRRADAGSSARCRGHRVRQDQLEDVPVGAALNPEGVRIAAAGGVEPGDTRHPLHYERAARPEPNACPQSDYGQIVPVVPFGDPGSYRGQWIGGVAEHRNHNNLP